MVEFGLKLQDNKVSEWSNHYLDYETLKAILKKAKAAKQNHEEYLKRQSEKRVSFIASPFSSSVDLEHDEAAALVNETTNLIASPEKNTNNNNTNAISVISPTGSQIDLSDPNAVHEEVQKQKSSSNLSLTKLSNYFSRGERSHTAKIEKLSKEFEELLHAEREKTVEFYNEKLSELETRLDILVQSVTQSSIIAPPSPSTHTGQDDEDGKTSDANKMKTTASPSFRHRAKQPSLTKGRFASVVSIVSKKIKKEKQIFDALQKGDTDKALQIELLSIDDDDDEDRFENEKVLAEANSIKRALTDHYRTTMLLKNFAIMNYTGFIKIVKKHDKTLSENKGKFKTFIKAENLFDEAKEVDELSKRVVRYYANWFCEGDVREATTEMLPKKGDGLEMDWSQLRLGYRMGMCAVLALWVCWDCIWGLVADGNTTIGGRAAFPVFRACGGLLCLQWFWGCSVFIWSRYRVNYIYLFDLDPRTVSSAMSIYEDAVENTLVFLLVMLLYYKAGASDIPQWIPTGWFPMFLVLYTTYQLLFPLKTRMPMWGAIWKVVTAPLNSPSFFHGYIGDIFTSMVKVFQDIAWTICWVCSGQFSAYETLRDKATFPWETAHWYKNFLIPIVCLLPLLIRFNQCLRRYIDTGDRVPHLPNAGKYALSQTVTLFGAFHPLYMEIETNEEKGGLFGIDLFQAFWMLIFVCSSLYSFTWDVFMDWGLGRKKYGYLGPTLMYPKRSYYFTVIGLDLVLRFMWVLTLLPPSSGAKFEVPSYLSAVTMMLELFRRTIWGFLRLENEHRSNAAGFRRVSFVPLHFNTGHGHKYSHKERGGQSVLKEVVMVSIVVLGICVSSIIAAQNANSRHNTWTPPSDKNEF